MTIYFAILSLAALSFFFALYFFEMHKNLPRTNYTLNRGFKSFGLESRNDESIKLKSLYKMSDDIGLPLLGNDDDELTMEPYIFDEYFDEKEDDDLDDLDMDDDLSDDYGDYDFSYDDD